MAGDDGAARIDAYIQGLGPAEAKAVQGFRKLVLSVAPDAKQLISYGMPAFQVGKVRVGVMAFKRHLTFFPFSGSFLGPWWDDLDGFEGTDGGVHFTPERPIPVPLLRRMVKARLAQGRSAAAKPKSKAKARSPPARTPNRKRAPVTRRRTRPAGRRRPS